MKKSFGLKLLSLILVLVTFVSVDVGAQLSGNYFQFITVNNDSMVLPLNRIYLVYESSSAGKSELITDKSTERYIINEPYDTIVDRLCGNLVELTNRQNGKKMSINAFNIVKVGRERTGLGYITAKLGFDRFLCAETYNEIQDAIAGCGTGGGGGGGITTVNDSPTIDFTLSGGGSTLTGVAKISSDANNQLQAGTDGALFVPQGGGGGGGQLLVYDAGNGIYVKASDTGITAVLGSGIATITVPSGVELVSVRIRGATANLSANNFRIQTNYASATYNTNYASLFPPVVKIWNTAAIQLGGPSDALPFTQTDAPTPQIQITSVATGDVGIRIVNLNAISDWILAVDY
jgi:hypothetical protein